MKAPVQIFSFGYYGWGSATEQLVRAVDAVERSRGYRPPIFVDIRIRRQGRAAGFIGTAFEKLLGPKRHRWLPKLGNRRIVSGTGRKIQIAEPKVADDLLDLALDANEDGRRVIFFCGCSFPKQDGVVTCHRHSVSKLLLKAATKREKRIEVVEWPGGRPQRIEIQTTPKLLESVRNGGGWIPVPPKHPLHEIGSLSWGSVATLLSDSDRLHCLVGPARWRQGGWHIPLWFLYEDDSTLSKCRVTANRYREQFGIEPNRNE